jgi:hypothetical protein
MVFKLGRSILGIMIATCIAGPQSETHAADDHHKRSGKAGREIYVRGYAEWEQDCSSSGFPVVLLDEPPRHGIVCLLVGNMRIPKAWFGWAPHCTGRVFRGVRVMYLPRPDYVGTDKMHYTVVFPRGRRTVMATLTISPSWPGSSDAMPPDISAPKPETQQSPGPVPFCTALVS